MVNKQEPKVDVPKLPEAPTCKPFAGVHMQLPILLGYLEAFGHYRWPPCSRHQGPLDAVFVVILAYSFCFSCT